MCTKHTLGPWECSIAPSGPFWHISSGYTVGGEQCISGRQAIATVFASNKKTAYGEMFKANAQLVAAAPELLHALQHIANYGGDSVAELRAIADAAIAKISQEGAFP